MRLVQRPPDQPAAVDLVIVFAGRKPQVLVKDRIADRPDRQSHQPHRRPRLKAPRSRRLVVNARHPFEAAKDLRLAHAALGRGEHLVEALRLCPERRVAAQGAGAQISSSYPRVQPLRYSRRKSALASASLDQFQAWARDGAELYRNDRRKAQAYYALESKSSQEQLRGSHDGVALESVSHLLRLYVEGLTGREMIIAPLGSICAAMRLAGKSATILRAKSGRRANSACSNTLSSSGGCSSRSGEAIRCITPRKVTSPTPAELRELWAEACTQADVHGLPPALAHRGHRRAWFVRWSVARPGHWGDFGLTVAGSLDAWLCAMGQGA